MFKVGDKVTVCNSTLGGREFIEGQATVRQAIGDDRYMVEFDQEPGETYERFVKPTD